jgi:tetratricopeptide (TPR) repeat protein
VNCKEAIKAFEEALKVFTLDKFPIQCAGTHSNLGNAYSTLAEVEDKAKNCAKAIAAYEEALKVRTAAEFPMDYAMTTENVGLTYWILAYAENKKENCRIAREKMEEALQIFVEQGLMYNVEKVKGHLAILEEFRKSDRGGQSAGAGGCGVIDQICPQPDHRPHLVGPKSLPTSAEFTT